MSISYSHNVPRMNPSQRIQEYGVGVFELVPTKSALKKALKKGLIQVDGKIATTATMIHGGETIVFTPAEFIEPKRTFNLPLEVLFEDNYLAAVNKPPGLLVSGNSFKTVAGALPQNLQASDQADVVLPQPVHRLDFATTGALLIGKTAESIRRLAKHFEDKKIEKTYYAVTIGEMDPEGTIVQAIDGKEAITRFKVVKSQDSPRFTKLNLVQLEPKTGRRHQLRIHLSELGNPILGDRDYTPEHLILKGKGMYLHAYSLEFDHPFSNKRLTIATSLPNRFSKLFPEYKV